MSGGGRGEGVARNVPTVVLCRHSGTAANAKCHLLIFFFLSVSVEASRSSWFQTGSGKLEITFFSGHYLVVDKHLTGDLRCTVAQADPNTGWELMYLL